MKKLKNLLNTGSLQWKLLSRFFLILMLLLLIMEAYQYVTLKQYLYNSKEQVLDARFHNIQISNLQQIQTPEAVVKNASSIIDSIIDSNISAAIIDFHGNRLAGTSGEELKKHGDNSDNHENFSKIEGSPPPISVPIPQLSQNDYIKLLRQRGTLEGYRLIRDENKNLQIVAWRKIGYPKSPSGLIQISISAKPVQDILSHQLYIFIGSSILVLIIGGILGGAVFRYTLKPLYNVTSTVAQIDVRQLNMRLPLETGQLEIDKLSIAFNNMLERIETSFEKEQYIKEKMRQFISDASHELRTPLTSIHGFVEVLLRGAAKNEKQLDLALNSILMESERLTKLVNDLLLLTKLEQKVIVEMALENISDIIKEIYPQLQILSGERKVALQLHDNIFVSVNRNQIKQVIFNLLQNAVHHTDEKNGVITISTNILDNFATLNITDNGTGIPKEHLSEIFDRFFRSESHRSRKHGGYGLGLSIVKSIIDAHNGKIDVTSELGVGTTFSIYLKSIK
jgi:Signal transduction histidine kinase